VIIKVNNGKEHYYKKVELPCNVDADSAITSYQNGILDVELKKMRLIKYRQGTEGT
jgi:HSP20 family protein